MDLVDGHQVNEVTSLGFLHDFHADVAEAHIKELRRLLGPVSVVCLTMLRTAIDLGGVVDDERA